MDLQDILFLLIFLGISFLSKKSKLNPLDEELDDQTEVVRKKIETLKRKRNGTNPEPIHTNIEIQDPNPFFENKQKEFSAYKHLPVYEQPSYDPQEIVKPTILLNERKISTKQSVKSLRENMKWHIILSKPVCTQSFYGNFTNR